ncbi:MAG: hypothetical protein ABII01_06160 [Candidatus Woesearchaeota archaeon]
MRKGIIYIMDDEKTGLDIVVTQIREHEKFDGFNLRKSQYPDEVAHFVEEAIKEGYEVPIVILDYKAPPKDDNSLVKNGFDSALAIKRISPYSQIIMNTAQAGPEVMEDALNHPGLLVGWIDKKKPEYGKRLCARIQKGLEIYEQLRPS